MQLTAVITRKTNPKKEKVILAAGLFYQSCHILWFPTKNDIYFPFCIMVFQPKICKFTKKLVFFLSRNIQLFIHSSKSYPGFIWFLNFYPQTWKFKLKKGLLSEGREVCCFFVNPNFQQAEGGKKKKRTKAESWRKQMLLTKRLSGQTPYFPGK